jgi:glycosyltransferase involved in cell wall biosynthesis
MKKTLSILTCSLERRYRIFKELEQHLIKQIGTNSNVELLANIDNGQKTIGLKRNELLRAASGTYVAFIDDDDWVSNDYVSKILKAIDYKNPDCCGIEGVVLLDKTNRQIFIHSIKYDDWFSENHTHYRCPNHLNPIKRDLALAVGFKDLSYGEDFDFSKRIKPLLKTEVFIPKPIYTYRPNIKNNF